MKHQWFSVLALAAALAVSPARADDTSPPPLAALCKQVFCRTPSVHLRVDDGHVFEQRMEQPMPVLLPNGWVSIYPGETVYLELQRSPDAVKVLRAVAQPEYPDTTLTLKFEQLAGKPDMMLTITNPLPVDLRFRMGWMGLDSDRIRATSSCPVRAGMSLFEHWPHAIFQLILADVQWLAPADDHSCK